MFESLPQSVSAKVTLPSGRFAFHPRLVLLISVALFLTACQRLSPEQRAQQLLAEAREDVKQGKIGEAVIEYRRAIQTDSKLTVLHLELGKLYIDRQDYLNGAQQLSTAVQLNPSNRDAHLAFASLLLFAKNYSDAKDQTDAVLAQVPGDPEALLLQARIAAGTGRIQEARSTAEQVLHVQPSNANAWLLLAGLQFEGKDYQASEHSFRQAIRYDPTQLSSTAAFSVLLLKQNRTGEAETLIRDYVARNPASGPAEYLLAAFLAQQRRFAEAEPVLRKVSELDGADPQQRMALANFYLSTHKFDLAEKEIIQIVSQHPDDIASRNALASLYMATNRTAEAERILALTLGSAPDNPDALLLRGRLRIEQTRIDDAVDDLQHATRAEPQSAPAHYYLALAELQKKQTKLAQADLQNALELQPDFVQARVLLAGIKLDAGQMKAGMLELDKAVDQKPPTLEPYITRAVLQSQQGGASGAEKDLLPLLERFPQSKDRAATYRALAWAKFNEKKFDAARRFLRQSAQDEPDSPETFYLSGLTYLAENKPKGTLALIQAHLQGKPNWPEGYAIGGELAALAGRNPDAETYFKKAVSIDPQLVPAWQGLGLVLTAESKLDAALEAFNQVILLSPKSGTAYFYIAQLRDKRGEWSQSQSAYQKSLELDPGNVAAKNNLAWSYAEHGGNIDVALRLAQEANQARPEDPEICDTLGWIYIKKNAPGTAIQTLTKSATLVPNNAAYNYHLGVAYLRSGDAVKAKALLLASLAMEPPLPLVHEIREALDSIKE